MTDTDREALFTLLNTHTELNDLSIHVVVNVIAHPANRGAVLKALGCRDNMSKADRSHLAVDKALRVIADFIERERGGNDE